jgi:hypothetical protein
MRQTKTYDNDCDCSQQIRSGDFYLEIYNKHTLLWDRFYPQMNIYRETDGFTIIASDGRIFSYKSGCEIRINDEVFDGSDTDAIFDALSAIIALFFLDSGGGCDCPVNPYPVGLLVAETPVLADNSIHTYYADGSGIVGGEIIINLAQAASYPEHKEFRFKLIAGTRLRINAFAGDSIFSFASVLFIELNVVGQSITLHRAGSVWYAH